MATFSLDGRGVWGRKDTCICMAESLHCSPITILLISYIPIENKKFKLKKRKLKKPQQVEDVSILHAREDHLSPDLRNKKRRP